jgi:hypothetical protein
MVIREIAGRVRGGPAVASKFATSIRFSPKPYRPRAPRRANPRRAAILGVPPVHHRLSAVAQSYSHVQRLLAKGSHRALGKL